MGITQRFKLCLYGVLLITLALLAISAYVYVSFYNVAEFVVTQAVTH